MSIFPPFKLKRSLNPSSTLAQTCSVLMITGLALFGHPAWSVTIDVTKPGGAPGISGVPGNPGAPGGPGCAGTNANADAGFVIPNPDSTNIANATGGRAEAVAWAMRPEPRAVRAVAALRAVSRLPMPRLLSQADPHPRSPTAAQETVARAVLAAPETPTRSIFRFNIPSG